jgi:RNA polymerase sigma-70 factor (ECF subfamily)
MNALHDKSVDALTSVLPQGFEAAGRRRPATTFAENWRGRSEKWGCLMVAARGGEKRAYEQLLHELDDWLGRYYARRLPPAAAEDARQDALLAVHAKRHVYSPSKPFGPWVAAIARHKWIDHIRDLSRFAALSVDDQMMIEESEESVINAIAVDDLLRSLKPAQARVIRLVKLDGASVADASRATGQSAALVKVNIHRGLKKLAAMVVTSVVARPREQMRTPANVQQAGA